MPSSGSLNPHRVAVSNTSTFSWRLEYQQIDSKGERFRLQDYCTTKSSDLQGVFANFFCFSVLHKNDDSGGRFFVQFDYTTIPAPFSGFFQNGNAEALCSRHPPPRKFKLFQKTITKPFSVFSFFFFSPLSLFKNYTHPSKTIKRLSSISTS